MFVVKKEEDDEQGLSAAAVALALAEPGEMAGFPPSAAEARRQTVSASDGARSSAADSLPFPPTRPPSYDAVASGAALKDGAC